MKRQVLFMPTWRTYAVEGKTQAEFEQTDYFQHWQAVISDPEAGEAADEIRL